MEPLHGYGARPGNWVWAGDVGTQLAMGALEMVPGEEHEFGDLVLRTWAGKGAVWVLSWEASGRRWHVLQRSGKVKIRMMEKTEEGANKWERGCPCSGSRLGAYNEGGCLLDGTQGLAPVCKKELCWGC